MINYTINLLIMNENVKFIFYVYENKFRYSSKVTQ